MFPQFSIFGRVFYTYSVLALLGGFVAFFVVKKLMNSREINDRKFYIMIPWVIFGMYLGGNILHNFLYLDIYINAFKNADKFSEYLALIINLFKGSVFYGGLTGAVLSAFIYLKATKQNVSENFDLLAVAIPLFHAFGRSGCFLSGCCYGVESDFGFVITKSAIEISNGVRRFPVQLLESFLCLLLFFAIYLLFKKNKFRGKLIWIYFLCYSVIRFFTEMLRGDTYRGIYANLSLSQWISIGYFTVSVIYFSVLAIKNRRNTINKN